MARAKSFADYSPEAQEYAYRQAQRKAQGKSITQYGQPEDFRKAYERLLNENRDVARAVQQGNEARGYALERGFKNTQEAMRIQGFAKPREVTDFERQLLRGQRSSSVGGTFLGQLASGQRSSSTRAALFRRQIASGQLQSNFPRSTPMVIQSSTKSVAELEQGNRRAISGLSNNRILALLSKLNDFSLANLSRKTNPGFRRIQNQALNEIYRNGRTSGLTRARIAAFISTAGVDLTSGVQAYYDFLPVLASLATSRNTRSEFVKSVKGYPKKFKQDAEDFGELLRISPEAAIAKIGTQYFLLRFDGKLFEVTGKLTTSAVNRIRPSFRKVKTTGLGSQYIEDVRKIGDIDIIPEGRGIKFKVNPVQAVGEANIFPRLVGRDGDTVLRAKPIIPKTTNVEKGILDAVRARGDAVSGSFAQEALLKKQFTRRHKDLDILTKDRPALMAELKKRFGNDIRFNKKKVSIEVLYRGKPVADLVEYAKGEDGFVLKYGLVRHRGLNIVNPEARLAAKVSQLGKGLNMEKVKRDIRLLYGNKVNLDSAQFKGAYGVSRREFDKYIGQSGPLATAQIDLLGMGILKPKQLDVTRWLYASPFDLKTKRPQVRVSRLGLDDAEQATFLDLLYGDVAFKRGKPQIFVFPKEKLFSAKKGLVKSKTLRTAKGFVIPKFTSELEVVLGKGYAVRRGRRLATTNINGRNVPIYEIKKIKLPPVFKAHMSYIDKLKQKIVNNVNHLDEINAKKALRKRVEAINKRIARNISFEEARLGKNLKRFTGLDYASRKVKGKKFFDVRKAAGGSAISAMSNLRLARSLIPRGSRLIPGASRLSPPSRPPRYPPSRPPYGPGRSPPRGGSAISRPPSRPPRYPPSRPPRSPPARPPLTPPTSRQGRGRLQRGGKAEKGYYVLEKRAGKFHKLNPFPVSFNDARDRLAYRLDNKLSRTAKIVSAGNVRRLASIRTEERGYYNRFKNNFRDYRIVAKKRVSLPRGMFIEKQNKALSTRGEIRQIQLNNLAKGRRKLAMMREKGLLRRR